MDEQVTDRPLAPAPDEPRSRRRRFVRVVAALSGCAVVAAGALWVWGGSGGSTTDDGIDVDAVRGRLHVEQEPGAPEAAPDARDAEFRRAILGRWWRDDYYGRASLELKEGGTGAMVIRFNFKYGLVLGSRVDADVEWEVTNGRAIFDSVRGRPESTFKTVTKEKGTRRDRKIVEITDEHMLLMDDLDDGSVARWERVK